VEVHWQGGIVKLMIVQDSTEPDSRGQANGIAPNYVHSLDGAHLRALARSAKKAGIDHLSVVHDSFATHAARTDELAKLLRSTFVDQYEPDLLRRFYEEVYATLPPAWAAALPEPPAGGDLDLNEVRRSPYLFS
jgi:DNA-directed RNA polymerase